MVLAAVGDILYNFAVYGLQFLLRGRLGLHTYLFRIILPLATASLATFGLFYAVGQWNTYMSALLYIPDSSKWPIQPLLRQIVYVSSSIGNEDAVDSEIALLASSIKMAVIIIATVPIICLYPFLQKYFAKGIMVGAVKG